MGENEGWPKDKADIIEKRKPDFKFPVMVLAGSLRVLFI